MEIYQLETFCRVARELNFSRAAEGLALTQPTVSRHIDALEREAGLQLFTHVGRKTILTEAGERLLAYAERILRTAEEARSALAELRNLESGRLHLGASTTPGRYLLPRLLEVYARRYPGIDLKLSIANSAAIAEALVEGGLDVGVLSGPVDCPQLYAEVCAVDELVPVARSGHPLAAPADRGERCAPLSLAELAAETLLLREPGSGTRRRVEEFLADRGIVFRRTIELGDLETIKQAVAAGLGVSFLSRMAVAGEIGAGSLAQLSVADEGLPLRRRFFVAYNKARRQAPAVLAFMALLPKVMVADGPLTG